MSSCCLQDAVCIDVTIMIEHFYCASFIVNRTGDVIAANAAAKTLFGDATIGRVLRKTISNYLAKLESAFAASLPGSSGNVHVMTLPRPDCKTPLILQANPLTPPIHDQKSIHPIEHVLILAFDLDERPSPTNLPALELLGLTPTENLIASHIGSAFNSDETASRLKISVLTVRTHLKHIYMKLGVKGHQKLVQIVTRLQMMA